MRILIPTHPGTNTGHPRLKGRGGGGLETAMEKMIDVLVEEGHEVSLLTPDDYPIEDPRILQVLPGFKSKKEAGRASWKVWTNAWLSVADMFDRVLLNDALLSLDEESKEKLHKVSDRVRAIYHLYDEQIDSSFMGVQAQVLSEIKSHGGRISCVSPTLNEYLRKRHPEGKLKPTPYLNKSLTLDISSLEFEHFQVGIALDPGEITESNGDFLFIGRGVKEKNLKLALQAFEKADTGSRKFHVVSTRPHTAGDQKYWEECMTKHILGKNIVPHIDITRDMIMRRLSASSILVFPSKKESFGIVPLEASSFGLNIIHKDLRAGCYGDADVHLGRLTVKSLTDSMESISVPSVEEKRARAAWTAGEFSEEKYRESLKSFVL